VSLIVTFTSAVPLQSLASPVPIARGSGCRTHLIAVGGTTTAGALSGAVTEQIATIFAQENCWVNIGPTPVAVVGGSGCWYMASGERLDFHLAVADKVAVIAA
jgi:hypothetical protein